jgi:hypothetical protein
MRLPFLFLPAARVQQAAALRLLGATDRHDLADVRQGRTSQIERGSALGLPRVARGEAAVPQ